MSTRLQTLDFRTSAADAVTNQLRRELLDGTIQAGSRILPKEVAERFALSVVPIREAIRHLEAEGLIVTSPQRATFAAEIGLEDLADVYELRRVVEPEFARRAARIATEADKRRCRSALKELVESPPYTPSFFKAHRNFHWQLLAPAAGAVTKSVLERLWQSVDRYMALGARNLAEHSSIRYLTAFRKEHTAIATAFESGNQKLLAELLDAHFTKTEKAMRQMFQAMDAKAASKKK